MAQQFIANLSGGEVSFDLYGRKDSELYFGAAARMQNFLSRTQGPAEYRGGFRYAHPSASNNTARVLRFKFNDEQTYIFEFTDQVLRIYEDTELTLETSGKTISGATAADPVVITSTAHGLANGDEVYISGVAGMTELNDRFYRIANVTTNTFELQDLFDNDLDGSGFTAYTSGGTATPVLELATPYTAAQLNDFQFAQQGNDLYVVHRSHDIRKITRVSATSWTIGTFVRTNDPFTTTDKYPGCVTFFEGRIIFASTNDNPDSVWASRAPSSAGAARYDDFTTGSNDDDAIIFPIASHQGDIAYILWLSSTPEFIAIGSTSGVSAYDGGGQGDAITPTNIRVRPIDPYPVQDLMPIANGSVLFYMQKGNRVLRSLEYDLLADSYKSFDRSFVASHMTKGGFTQLAFQRGRSDIMWAVRADGQLIGITLKGSKEDVSGWHRHIVGGSGKVISIASESVDSGYDRLWAVIERTINSTTVRYLEYLTEPFEGLFIEDYYTGNLATAETVYKNETFEEQRISSYLDAHAIFDGSDRGSITMTPGATTGTSITFTASSALFASTDVGKEIWKKYEDGAGGGRAIIRTYTNSTTVVCDIISDFDSTDAIAAGSWFLTSDTITGLYHLEGATIQVMADGRLHPDVTVSSGSITLTRQSGYVVLGYSYIGIYKTLELVLATQQGNIISVPKNVTDVDILVVNSIGAKYGTQLDRMQQITSSRAGQATDRPPLPFTGPLSNFYADSWSESKSVIIMQDQPYPCFISGLNLEIDVGEE